MRRPLARAALVVIACSGAYALLASAQTLDVKRPRTFVVGAPRGHAVGERVDATRRGLSSDPLPSGALHVDWRRALGSAIESAPLADASDTIYALAARGDVVAFASDGSERWRAATGAPQPGAGAILSDGTIAFVAASGDAVGVKNGAVRFRTRIGRAEAGAPRGAVIATDDGGAIVATSLEIAAVDADGNLRTRTSAPETIAAPMLSAGGRVVFVGASGAVFAWTPGAGDPSRIGGFGGRIDGAAAMVNDHTLVAVVGSELKSVDIAHNVLSARGAPALGAFVGPVAARGDSVFVVEYTPVGSFLVGLDAAGAETFRAQATSYALPPAADGGAAALAIPPHAGPIVDASGTVVFAAPDGPVGVAAQGSIELVSELVCARSAAPGTKPASTVAGIAPCGGGAFAVACSSGALIRVSAGKTL